MGFLQDIPVEIVWVALVMGVIYAMFRWCIVSAEERDEDAVLYDDMDGYARDVEPSADQELKK